MADFESNETVEESAAGSEAGRKSRGRSAARKFVPKVRVCAFCVDKGARLDYKQPEALWRYLNERGKIRPRRQTGTCAKHQRQLARTVKRARHLALLPFVARAS